MGCRLPQHAVLRLRATEPAARGRVRRRAVGRLQRSGAVPQCLNERGLNERGLPGLDVLARVLALVRLRPGLQQGLRRGQHGLLEVRGRQVGAYRGLDARMHPHRPGGATRVDADQAGPGQVGHGRTDEGLVRHVRGAGPASHIAASGRADQHRAGNTVRVEHGGQRERRPGRARGRKLVCAFRRQRPGGQHGGGDAVHPDRGHVLAPLAEPGPVLPAAQPVQGHHGGGLGQRERQPVQVSAQVESLGSLAGKVGEPGAQVRQHLAAAEPPDRRDPRSGREDGRGQAGGDDDLPGQARRPEVFQVSQAGQVVEDQRPRAPGVSQPAGEAARGGLGGLHLIGRADRPGRLREAGDNRLPAGRRHPDQHVDRAGAPQRVAERHRDLGLARAALGRGRGGGVLAVGQHHGVARVQARPQIQPGFRALVERLGERRDGPGQLDRRMRTGPLPNHVDSLSRVARRSGSSILTRPHLKFRQAATASQS